MKGGHCFCIGASHLTSGKPCQDRATYLAQSGIYLAVVCDGHGGDRYFRSDKGAEFLVEITKNSLVQFAKTITKQNSDADVGLFVGKPYTQIPTIRESLDSLPRQSNEDKAICQLLTSIITRWKDKVEVDVSEQPITEWEEKNVKPEYIEDFKNKRQIEKIYGCTLMAFVQTRKFWLAFHIGDGKCIMFDKNDNCFEPVLWDDKCFLNRTTSICDPAPLEEFRYSYQGDGEFPVAIFLGSDGLDDSFGDGIRLHNFYLNVLRHIVSEGLDSVKNSLEESLSIISKRGSHDDMSVAFVYDDKILKEHVVNLTRKQIERINLEIAELKDRIYAKKRAIDEFAGELESKRGRLIDGEKNSSDIKACERLRINLKYAYSDYDALRGQVDTMNKQLESLYDFLGEEPKLLKQEDEPPRYLDKITYFIETKLNEEDVSKGVEDIGEESKGGLDTKVIAESVDSVVTVSNETEQNVEASSIHPDSLEQRTEALKKYDDGKQDEKDSISSSGQVQEK